jgi:hypothetical protein
MNIRIILTLIIFNWFTLGCENTDNTIYSGDPPVEVIDPNVDPNLEVPALNVGVGFESGEFGLYWKSTANAEKYELEETSFLWGSRIVYSGTGLSYHVGVVDSEQPLYFRIRAVSGLKVSKWSSSQRIPL